MSCRNVSKALLGKTPKFLPKQHTRKLSLHEYQSQDLLRQFGLRVPRGKVARTPEEVRKAAADLGGGRCIIKSQILKGGRGKGSFDSGLSGGIQVADNPQDGEEKARRMLGHRLRTKQTGEAGLPVHKVYVAEALKYTDEWYLAMTIDRERYQPAIILSKSGGMDIETVAKEHPEDLVTIHFSVSEGITPDVFAKVAERLRPSSAEARSLEEILKGMYKVFTEKDATLLEVNPLVRSSDGSFTCLDAKFSFDDAARKRQPDLFALRDAAHEIAEESEAEKYGLVYIRMDGNIGNVVNGAGLAMATNDAIEMYGGASANFLDAGGQATKETMQKALGIVMADERVTTILVNIYGGIIDCRMIAESIIGAASELPMRVPVVIRLQGTNSAQGLKLLEEADLGLHVEADFGAAAKKAVELANA